MTITATLQFLAQIVQTWESADVPSLGDGTITHNAFNKTQTLHAASTPPVTKKYAKKIISTGADALDLTSLTDDLESAMDMSGLKLQYILLNNLSTANTVVISDGGANPYSINATAAKTVAPGAHYQEFFDDQLDDVAAGALAIVFTGTAGQTFELLMVFG